MGYLGTSWDGVSEGYNFIDKVDCSALTWCGGKLVCDDSYPPTYNIKGGILYNDKVGVECENYVGVEDSIGTSMEPSNLNNTKSNIRKIKPDNNSKLKRV